jgi:hypothetical protein
MNRDASALSEDFIMMIDIVNGIVEETVAIDEGGIAHAFHVREALARTDVEGNGLKKLKEKRKNNAGDINKEPEAPRAMFSHKTRDPQD